MSTARNPFSAQNSIMSSMDILPDVKRSLNENALRLTLSDGAIADGTVRRRGVADPIVAVNARGTPSIDLTNVLRASE